MWHVAAGDGTVIVLDFYCFLSLLVVGAFADDERHFIKHVLAFFASSDGIVIENLAVRFIAGAVGHGLIYT
jgi:hypothetical protein